MRGKYRIVTKMHDEKTNGCCQVYQNSCQKVATHEKRQKVEGQTDCGVHLVCGLASSAPVLTSFRRLVKAVCVQPVCNIV